MRKIGISLFVFVGFLVGILSVAVASPWEIGYHDGSGNGFRFWQEPGEAKASFEYVPVKPKESSSGTYSGGDPKSGPLDGKRVKELRRRVRKMESDVSLHLNAHQMTSGAFHLKDADGERDFVVKSGPLLKDFDKFLAGLLKGSKLSIRY